MLIKSCFSWKTMGKYFHTMLKSTQLFFSLRLLAARGMQRPSGTRGGSAADPREPLWAAGKHLQRTPDDFTCHECGSQRACGKQRYQTQMFDTGRSPRAATASQRRWKTAGKFGGSSSGSSIPPKRAWENAQPWNLGWRTPKKDKVTPGRVKGFCSVGLFPPDVRAWGSGG